MRNSNRFATSFANLIDSIKDNLLSFIIISLLSIYLLWFAWQYFTMEKVTETIYTLTDRAKLNGYYSSELLLNELSDEQIDDDIATSQIDMDLLTLIDELPYLTMTDDENADKKRHPTLIINNIGSSLNEEKLTELTQWIEQGGHLITFTSSDVIDTDDWQKVEEQLQTLKGSEATAEQVNNDVKLQDLLTEVNKDSSNTLLNHLGIYRIRKAKVDEYDDIDKEETSDYKTLGAELDKLGFPDDSTGDSDKKEDADKKEVTGKSATSTKSSNSKKKGSNENIINDLQVREHILSLYESIPINIISSDSEGIKSPIAISDSSSSYRFRTNQLNTDILLASVDNAKPNNQLSPIQLEGIRSYLQQQLKQAKKLQNADSNEVIEKRNRKRGSSIFTPAEQAKTIKTLLKISDEQLIKIFRPKEALSDSLVDVNIGKGRITVLDNVSIWSNPTAPSLMHINQSQIIHPNYRVSLFNTKDDMLKFNENLYSNDHASMLVTLTKNSNEIWLFPNVDIDSLPIMLWKKAQLAVLGLAFLTFIWIWSLYNRFGKRQYIVNSNQSDIFRYFRQIGRYGWAFDNGKRLTKVTRSQAEKLAKKALSLNTNESLTTNHLPKLSQTLNSRLIEKLSKNVASLSMVNNHKLAI